jgi:hypothetical protein
MHLCSRFAEGMQLAQEQHKETVCSKTATGDMNRQSHRERGEIRQPRCAHGVAVMSVLLQSPVSAQDARRGNTC